MLTQLNEIMTQLPSVVIEGKSYKPEFRYGTRLQLTEDLSLYRKKGERYYPLVYLETPINGSEIVEFRFILATLNIRSDMRNKDRVGLTFTKVLEPLRKNLVKALLRSGVFKRVAATPKNEFSGEYHFNYHIQPDIWDALVYNTTFRYTPNCKVRIIKF